MQKSSANSKLNFQNFLEIYQVISVIGKGRYGKVYLVSHKKDETLCALKIISKKKFKNFREAELILTEKKVLLAAAHPSITKLHASF